MALVWIGSAMQGWERVDLEAASGDCLGLTADANRRIRLAVSPAALDAGTLLVRQPGEPGETWVLLRRDPRARVNAHLLVAGIRVLRDRDEIHLPGAERAYFSTERLAAIQPYPQAGRVVCCPRCRRPISPGNPGVLCPGCKTWHHQDEEYPCWTYAKQCALCPQGTSLDAGYQWTPEELDHAC